MVSSVREERASALHTKRAPAHAARSRVYCEEQLFWPAVTKVSSFQVRVSAAHCLVCIRDLLHQFEDDRIEENKARLFEEAAAKLRRHFDRRE